MNTKALEKFALETKAERAYKLGERAFADGKPQTPALNSGLMILLEGLPVGGGQSIMQAYLRGWHDACDKAFLG